MTNYIFCPRCGSSMWIVDKTKRAEGGSLSFYQCGDCHDFGYTEHCKIAEFQDNNNFDPQPTLYDVRMMVGDYKVIVWLFREATLFMNRKINNTVILSINRIIDFDWYATEEDLLNKIKMYLTFS